LALSRIRGEQNFRHQLASAAVNPHYLRASKSLVSSIPAARLTADAVPFDHAPVDHLKNVLANHPNYVPTAHLKNAAPARLNHVPAARQNRALVAVRTPCRAFSH
jgi:hypothetical protein